MPRWCGHSGLWKNCCSVLPAPTETAGDDDRAAHPLTRVRHISFVPIVRRVISTIHNVDLFHRRRLTVSECSCNGLSRHTTLSCAAGGNRQPLPSTDTIGRPSAPATCCARRGIDVPDHAHIPGCLAGAAIPVAGTIAVPFSRRRRKQRGMMIGRRIR